MFNKSFISMLLTTTLFTGLLNPIPVMAKRTTGVSVSQKECVTKGELRPVFSEIDYGLGEYDSQKNVYHISEMERNVKPVEIKESNVKSAAEDLSCYIPEFEDLPALRNQGIYGTCWAHAACCASEMFLARNGLGEVEDPREADLSELHLAYFTYNFANDPLGGLEGDITSLPKTDFLDMGSNYWAASVCLANWKGTASENVLPYSEASRLRESGLGEVEAQSVAFDDAAHLKNFYLVNTQSNIDLVKYYIKQNGAVATSIHENSKYYNSENNTFYCPDMKDVNHGVTIVGWDDNIPAENFANAYALDGAPGDGGWLIRNSWTAKPSDDKMDYSFNGYFWMSYYDNSLAAAAVFEYEDVSEHDNNYQYDGSISNTSLYLTNQDEYGTEIPVNWVEAANVFSINACDDGELLEAVSFVSSGVDEEYTINIYKNPDEENPASGTRLATLVGETSCQGLYSVPLDTSIELEYGDRISVCVKLSVEKGSYPGIDCEIPYISEDESYQVGIKPGQSYLNMGDNWADFVDIGCGNARIKAYTSNCHKTEADIAAATATADAAYAVIMAQDIFTLVNDAREERGLPALSLHPALVNAAKVRVAEIVEKQDHTRPNGTSGLTAITEAGYDGVVSAENYAFGFVNAKGAVDAWLASDKGHRENILNNSFSDIGIACVRYDGTWYFVQCFGGTQQAVAAAAATATGKAIEIANATKNATSTENAIATESAVATESAIATESAVATEIAKATTTPATDATATANAQATATANVQATATIAAKAIAISQEIAALINEERRTQGLKELSFNEQLYEASRVRTLEVSELFSEKRPDGREGYTVISDTGYDGISGQVLIYMGADSAQAVFDQVLSENDTILEEGLSDVGICAYQKDEVWYFSICLGVSKESADRLSATEKARATEKAIATSAGIATKAATMAKEIVDGVNKERALAGIPLLKNNDALVSAALTRAKELTIRQDGMRPDGRDGLTAIDDAGYAGMITSECFIWGFDNAQALLNVLTDTDDGMGGTFLNNSFYDIGVACYQTGGTWYYAFCFGATQEEIDRANAAATATGKAQATATGQATATRQATATVTATGTIIAKPTATVTATGTITAKPTATVTATGTVTVKPTATVTATGNATSTPIAGPTITSTITVSGDSIELSEGDAAYTEAIVIPKDYSYHPSAQNHEKDIVTNQLDLNAVAIGKKKTDVKYAAILEFNNYKAEYNGTKVVADRILLYTVTENKDGTVLAPVNKDLYSVKYVYKNNVKANVDENGKPIEDLKKTPYVIIKFTDKALKKTDKAIKVNFNIYPANIEKAGIVLAKKQVSLKTSKPILKNGNVKSMVITKAKVCKLNLKKDFSSLQLLDSNGEIVAEDSHKFKGMSVPKSGKYRTRFVAKGNFYGEIITEDFVIGLE